MNNTLRLTWTVLAILIVAGALFLGGMLFGNLFGFGRMMGGYGNNVNGSNQGNGYGLGMMNGFGNNTNNPGQGYGPGMMGGNGGGMMGETGNNPNVKPLSVDQAKQAVEKYLNSLNNADLKIDEIMIFNNNAYARIVEKSTNVGAFELLVDPSTLAVYPEYGPNMLWNLKYGGLNHQGMMSSLSGARGMMGQAGGTPAAVPAAMPINAEQALKAAQDYLDVYMTGTVTAEKADPFYGYYTIDILRNGKITGMLSVNGYYGQVFFHTWHGDFIEMAEQ